MRKLVVVVALIVAVVFAAASGALEVNSLRAPAVIPPNAADSAKVVVLAGRGHLELPDGIMAFTGTGDEFWASFWTNPGDTVGGWAWSSWVGIPGSMTLPVPSAQRRGDSLYVLVKFYATADSVSYIWTDR